jgi:hypothetical protein
MIQSNHLLCIGTALFAAACAVRPEHAPRAFAAMTYSQVLFCVEGRTLSISNHN